MSLLSTACKKKSLLTGNTIIKLFSFMHFVVISIFPEMFSALTAHGISSRALATDTIQISTINPRDFTTNAYQSVDDRPFGGGVGMVMRYEPLEKSLLQAKKTLTPSARVVYLSPQGTCLTQERIKALCQAPELILLCGRYKGIDERIIKDYVDEEISIGDYVLSGGEIPAMVLIDSIARLLPNALNTPESAHGDSFYDGLLDHPHYTRPAVLENGSAVPEVLLSGNHQKIDQWKHKQRLKQTLKKRNDLINWQRLSDQDQEFVRQLAENNNDNDKKSN